MDSPQRTSWELVLITPYYFPITGGVTTYVSGLARELTRRGAKVTVLTRQGDEAPGVLRGPPGSPAFIRWCRQAVQRISPQVIHSHGHWYCLAGAFSRFGRPLARRVVYTVHTIPDVPLRFRLPFRRLLRGADVVTFVSETSKQEFSDKFGPVPGSAIVFPGVRDIARGAALTRSPAAAGFRISAMSMMSWAGKVEGIRLLLEATTRLSRVLPDVSLTLIGDGEFRPDLQACSKELGIEDRVHFVGVIQDPEEILSQSDVFCHLSFKDSLPQAVLEAMSLGLPVVVNEGALGDAIFRSPESGIVRCPATVEGVVQALSHLASSSEDRRQLGAESREFVDRVFSWRRSGEKVWELYGWDSVPASDQ